MERKSVMDKFPLENQNCIYSDGCEELTLLYCESGQRVIKLYIVGSRYLHARVSYGWQINRVIIPRESHVSPAI